MKQRIAASGQIPVVVGFLFTLDDGLVVFGLALSLDVIDDLLDLGLVYERQKKFADAIATYEEFLRIFPNSNEATAVRSFIVQLKKDMNEN